MIRGIERLHIREYLIFIIYFIDLVQCHDHRRGRASLQAGKNIRVGVFAQGDIDQPQHDVGFGQGVLESPIHRFGQPRAVLRLETRRIEEYQLRILVA